MSMHYYFFDSASIMTQRDTDSTQQLLYYKHLLHDLFLNENFFWSWQYGLGGDLFGQFNYYYTLSPFFLSLLLFDFNSLYSIAETNLILSMAKHFCAMLAVFIYLQYHRRSYTASLMSALFYGGTTIFAIYSLNFDYMVDQYVWLPLLILTFDYFVERHKVVPFIAMLSFVIASSFYYAFINSVFLIFYSIYKYMDLPNRTKSIRGFFHYVRQITVTYIISLGIAAFAFLPAVYQFFNSDRISKEYDIPLLFDIAYYKEIIGVLFLAYRNHDLFGLAIGLPIFCFTLLVAGWTLRSKKMVPKLLFAGFLIGLMFIPFTYSLFNGFSAMQNRWFYLVAFTCSFVCAYIFDELTKEKNKQLVNMILLLVAFFLYVVWVWDFESTREKWFNLCIYLMGILSFVSFVLYSKYDKWRLFWSSILLISIIFHGTIQHYYFYSKALGAAEKQVKLNNRFYHSVGLDHDDALQVSSILKQYDTEFGRTIWNPLKEHNQSMYYGYKGHATYQSLIPANVHQFYKTDYNILGRNIMSTYSQYDNRLYLETVLSNQFYVTHINASREPYGYSTIAETETLKVLENNYKLPVGFLYTDWLTTSQFEKLNIAERDQVLLKAVVLDDPSIAGISSTFDQTLHVSTQKVGIADVELVGIERTEHNTYLSTTDENSYIRIPIIQPSSEGELILELEVKELTGTRFIVSALNKSADYFPASNIWSYPKETIAINLGWNVSKDFVDLYLTKGEYEIKNIRVYHNSYENYAEDVEELQANGLQQIRYTENSLSGTIHTQEDGIFFLSIPYSIGWTAKLNGKEIELVEVNHAFLGFPLSKGEYELELTYVTPLFREGLIISVASIVIAILLVRYRRITL